MAYLDAKLSFSYDWRTFSSTFAYLRSYNKLLKNDRLNVYYALEERAFDPKTADRIFVLFEGKEYTFKQAYEHSLRYAQWLKAEHGIVQDEVVALDFTNRPEFIWLIFGLWSLGAKPALINHNLTDKALTHCVRVSTARLVIADGDIQSQFTNAVLDELSSPEFHDAGKGAASVSIFDARTEIQIASMQAIREPDAPRGHQEGPSLAVLIYTSGTTGLPKAAIVSWSRLRRIMPYMSNWLGLTPEDRFYTGMPLYHSAAFVLGMCNCLEAGCTFALARKFSATNFWAECRQSKATIIQYVGETLRYLLAVPPSPEDRNHNVRMAYGNGLRPDIWNVFKERFGVPTICEFYAATEGVGGSFNYSSNDFSAGAIGRSGSLVRALFGGGSAIIRLDLETEEPLRDATTGLCVRVDKAQSEGGEFIGRLDENNIKDAYTGYWRNDSASNKKILRNVFKTGDAWYRTGDILRQDTDGRTYFVDRIGDTFRWKSENVSTNEVSEALGAHPAISEANVYGVALPQHDGRAGCAATVLKDGVKLDKDVCASLGQHVTKSLPGYARPIFLRVTGSLAATGTNKHLKHILRQEGVEHEKVRPSGDVLLWLQNGVYVPFGEKDWTAITGGQVRL